MVGAAGGRARQLGLHGFVPPAPGIQHGGKVFLPHPADHPDHVGPQHRLGLPAGRLAGGGQPHQCPPVVGRVVDALGQTGVLQLAQRPGHRRRQQPGLLGHRRHRDGRPLAPLADGIVQPLQHEKLAVGAAALHLLHTALHRFAHLPQALKQFADGLFFCHGTTAFPFVRRILITGYLTCVKYFAAVSYTFWPAIARGGGQCFLFVHICPLTRLKKQKRKQMVAPTMPGGEYLANQRLLRITECL